MQRIKTLTRDLLQREEAFLWQVGNPSFMELGLLKKALVREGLLLGDWPAKKHLLTDFKQHVEHIGFVYKGGGYVQLRLTMPPRERVKR